MAMNNTRTNLLRKQAPIRLGADHEMHTTTAMALCSRLCMLNGRVTPKHAVSDTSRILSRLPMAKFIAFAVNQRVTVNEASKKLMITPRFTDT